MAADEAAEGGEEPLARLDAELALFIVVAVLSIYPTIKFLGWRKALRESRVPDFDACTRRKVRMLVHLELTLLFVIMLMAVMMARGIWFLG